MMNDFERLLKIANKTVLTETGFCYHFTMSEITFLSKESKLKITVQEEYDKDYQKILVEYDQFEGAYELVPNSHLFTYSSHVFGEIIQWIKEKTIDQAVKGLYPR